MHFVRFSTDLVSGPDRGTMWKQATGQTDVIRLNETDSASIFGADLGGVRVSTASLGRYALELDKPAARGHIKFIFQEEGECTIQQAQNSIQLRAGDWCMFDKARPYRVFSNTYARQTGLLILGELLNARASPGREWPLHCQSAQGAARILRDSLRSSLAELNSLSQAQLLAVGHVLIELARLTIREESDTPQQTAATGTLRLRIVRYIEDNLDDPDLSVDSIAAGVGCSKRYVHKAFLGTGTTVAKLVWLRRVERCRAELMDAARGDRTITQIAHQWGFSDSQHFSRLFRARYGVSPRLFRNATV